MSEIQITVVAFGIARDIIGGRDVQLTVQSGATVDHAMSVLKEKFPAFNQLASLQLAVNEEYVVGNHLIESNDELVIIPPVSGG